MIEGKNVFIAQPAEPSCAILDEQKFIMWQSSTISMYFSLRTLTKNCIRVSQCFLLHTEQMLMRSIMSGNMMTSLETIYWGRYYALVATFWSHRSTCWGLLQSIFSGGQWLESCAMHLDLGDEKYWFSQWVNMYRQCQLHIKNTW